MTATEVKQVHEDYLDTLYVCKYFETIKQRTSWWSRHCDFVIGLTSSGGGATGLIGTLGKWPDIAWVCAPLTVAGAAMAIARASYGWGKSIEAADKVIEDYGKISMDYRFFIDKIDAEKKWTSEFKKKAFDLRQTRMRIAPRIVPPLDVAIQASIQNSIKASVNRTKWWVPQDIMPNEKQKEVNPDDKPPAPEGT
jgi:hypothetical protein